MKPTHTLSLVKAGGILWTVIASSAALAQAGLPIANGYYAAEGECESWYSVRNGQVAPISDAMIVYQSGRFGGYEGECTIQSVQHTTENPPSHQTKEVCSDESGGEPNVKTVEYRIGAQDRFSMKIVPLYDPSKSYWQEYELCHQAQ